MSVPIDQLAAWTASIAADSQAALIASVTAVIVSVFCALLVRRQWRRLAAMQTRLDKLSSAIRSLESDDERLFIRSLRSSPKSRKSPSQLSDTLEEKLDEKKLHSTWAAPQKRPPNEGNG
jgi:hypothetical protein